ncbi:methyl-accepting chemotaxis protein [Hydrogenovibrio sp. SC-1]|uniref:HAMP domain-containing methyl-accepting chemotaxis protein n=1 Tax=Hydrogenovibrio sp. SC-1 TaxID=2065820 RepID=UPI000C7A20E4|nr:methyl-accepting chemotaxis protein [Hydrogenovibrio sp. SC-1]PLA75148.1 methyl-accepting chemotaxis protein [Hydrogenovibrio sp. SC-1]
MEKFLQKLTIKQKMRFGFGVIWAVLAVITIQAAVNLYIVREDVKNVVEVKQPIALQANRMMSELEKGMNALGMYLLTTDQDNLTSYQDSIRYSEHILSKLKHQIAQQNSPEEMAILKGIETQLAKLPALIEQVTATQADVEKKFPAYAYFNAEMMPISDQVQQSIKHLLASELSQLTMERQSILEALMTLQTNWLNATKGVAGYIVFREEGRAAETEHYLNLFEHALDQLSSQYEGLLNESQQSMALQLKDQYEYYRESFMALKRTHQSPKWRMDTWVMKARIQPVFHDLETKLEQIATQSVADMQQTSQKVVDSTLGNLILLLTLSVLGQLTGMMISRKVTNSVVKPVLRSAQAMKDIASGEGDLTRRLNDKGKDELAEMARYFNEFVSKIQSTLKEVTATVKDLEVSSSSLSEVTHESKNGVEQQLTATKQLNKSMETMSQKAKSVEDHSHNTSRATHQAAESVKKGGEVVKSAAQNICKVSEGMEEITRAVMLLNEDGQTISTVINVIREIAEQTNLLALNAAIEAARAGDYGRGFAVVADEVRKLAQRTQESTVQIEDVIEKIRKSTSETVKVVDSGRETTQLGYDSVMQVERVLSPVVVLMDDINQMSTEMLTAAQSQTSLAETVNQHIDQIQTVTEKTVEGSVNNEASSRRLEEIADKLKMLVHQFKI